KEITINSNIEVLDYNLISMNGKRLKAQINKINTHKYSINQNLPTGVYIIQFFSENKILTEKIFIH
ncbi:MAG: T9SS type A sorting domain-containing protein, partial [Bacteroidota bacterium]|nr:T9SS type A sorting domain-containing protein [Bacteroidota bacterium]